MGNLCGTAVSFGDLHFAGCCGKRQSSTEKSLLSQMTEELERLKQEKARLEEEKLGELSALRIEKTRLENDLNAEKAIVSQCNLTISQRDKELKSAVHDVVMLAKHVGSDNKPTNDVRNDAISALHRWSYIIEGSTPLSQKSFKGTASEKTKHINDLINPYDQYFTRIADN